MNAPRVGNAVQALNRIRQDELDSRRRARTILQPSEVSEGLSPHRVLMTTLGGILRPITTDDLAKFRATIAQHGTRARQGLTAAEALSLSRPDDIEKARKEIRYSMASRLHAGRVEFVTNTGPMSQRTRHFVNVEFAQYAQAVSRPGTPTQAATWLCKESPLRFECSCEHFRYFLRYVASSGGWVAGRVEHGFPKITNPLLSGACCKHAIRVMTDLQQSAGIRSRVAQMVEAERARVDRPGKAKPRVFTVSQAEAERMLPKSARRIRIVQPGQRVGTPKQASVGDIEKALKAFKARTDTNGQAISRALEALLQHQQGQR